MRSSASWDRRCFQSKESLTVRSSEGPEMKARGRRIGPGDPIPPLAPSGQESADAHSFSESEDHFQKLFLSTKDAILITDSAAAQFLDVNLQASAMLRYSRTELLNLPPTRILVRKEDLSGWLRNPGKKPQFATELRHKSGAIVPCRVSVRPIEFNRKPCLLVIAHRATEP